MLREPKVENTEILSLGMHTLSLMLEQLIENKSGVHLKQSTRAICSARGQLLKLFLFHYLTSASCMLVFFFSFSLQQY